MVVIALSYTSSGSVRQESTGLPSSSTEQGPHSPSSEKGDISEHKVIRRGAFESRQYFADDAAGAEYYQEVLEKLVRCGALGAFSWMFSDYHPVLWEKPPFDTHEHERFFGLTRYDGTVKPSGEAMRAFSERVATGGLPARTIAPLELDPNEWYLAPSANFDHLWKRCQAYRQP